jgi:hypothetical protein
VAKAIKVVVVVVCVTVSKWYWKVLFIHRLENITYSPLALNRVLSQITDGKTLAAFSFVFVFVLN